MLMPKLIQNDFFSLLFENVNDVNNSGTFYNFDITTQSSTNPNSHF